MHDFNWAALIAALVGAGSANVAAYLSNRWAEKRFERQLASDSTEKRLQRESDLRKAIYLEAIEAMAKLQEFMSCVNRDDLTTVSLLEIIKGSSSALAKVFMVGLVEASKAILRVQSSFAVLSLDLMKYRYSIDLETLNLKQTEQQIEQHFQWRAQLLTQWESVRDSGNNEKIKVYLDDLKKIGDQVDHLLAQTSGLPDKIVDMRIELFRQVSLATASFAEKAIEAILQIRGEMGFTVSNQEFRELLVGDEQGRIEASESFLTFIGEFRKKDNATNVL